MKINYILCELEEKELIEKMNEIIDEEFIELILTFTCVFFFEKWFVPLLRICNVFCNNGSGVVVVIALPSFWKVKIEFNATGIDLNKTKRAKIFFNVPSESLGCWDHYHPHF